MNHKRGKPKDKLRCSCGRRRCVWPSYNNLEKRLPFRDRRRLQAA